jgi:hypothetical protein
MSYKTAKTRAVTAVAVFLALALGFPLPASAADSNQADTYTDTYYKNSQGSDSSLQNSSVYAMQALMDLAGGKLPNAVKNGYNAYGKYRTAENLDRVKDQNAQLANAMTSVGTANKLPTERTNTSFRRLDTSFLHQGDAGKVAEQFEKATGMKRESFLTQMADVSEQKIKASDPMMIDKAFSRFEGFLKKVPNAEFRKNAEKSIAMVPDTMRRGMVAQAVQKLAGMFADSGGGAAPALDSTITDLAKNKLADSGATTPTPAPLTSAVTGAGDLANGIDGKKDSTLDPTGGRDPASAAGGGLDMSKVGSDKGGSLNGGSGKNGAEGAVAAALAAQGADGQSGMGSEGAESIFRQVTKRYRILTPLLVNTP